MNYNYDYVMQDSTYDCGLACLMTLFKHYKKKINKEDLLSEISNINNGINAYELIEASKKYGLHARGVRLNLDILTNNDLPVIAHVIKDKQYFHYIVIFKIKVKEKRLVIFDPAEGLIELSYDDFNSITTGVYIIFGNNNKTNSSKDYRFLKFIKELAITNKKAIIKSIIFSFLFICISFIFQMFVKSVFQAMNANNIMTLYTIFLIFFLALILKNIFAHQKEKMIESLSFKIDNSISQMVISHILHLPYKYYYNKTTGEFIDIVYDIDNFKEIITKIFILCFIDILVMIIIFIYLSLLNILYFIIFTFLMGIIIIISLKYQKYFYHMFIKLKQKKIAYSSSLIETFSSYATIKGLHIERELLNKQNNLHDDFQKINKKYQNLHINFGTVLNILIDLFYFFLIAITGYFCFYQKQDISNIIFFSSIFYLMTGFLGNIVETITMHKIYKTSISRILDVLDQPKESFTEKLPKKLNKIVFSNVSYKVATKVIIDNFNLEINKGEHLFLSGQSGSGKSTLMKLLNGYIFPNEGKITIDSLNINSLDLGYIRSVMTYLSQQETLYVGTIFQNLAMINSDEVQIKKALDVCNLNHLDLNYILEENGNNLSGGERKRLLIARSLLKNSLMLILDESFNEIDIKMEETIINNIYKFYPDLTLILITHRNSNKSLFKKHCTLKKEE